MIERRTQNLRAVAAVLLEHQDEEHWGYDLIRRTGITPGVLYPMLSRLLDAEWLTDRREDPAALTDHYTPRRYYTLTTKGREACAELIEESP
jgi:PadR family transcriptional regulator PadR